MYHDTSIQQSIVEDAPATTAKALTGMKQSRVQTGTRLLLRVAHDIQMFIIN